MHKDLLTCQFFVVSPQCQWEVSCLTLPNLYQSTFVNTLYHSWAKGLLASQNCFLFTSIFCDTQKEAPTGAL